MSKPLRVCPDCGAWLDSGERCDCQHEPTQARDQTGSKSRRYETCRECGKVWNVSIKAVLPLNGYLCPKCWGRYGRR